MNISYLKRRCTLCEGLGSRQEGRVVFMCVCLFWKNEGWDEFICRFPPHLSTCHCHHVCFEAADGEAASRKRTALLCVFFLCACKISFMFLLKLLCRFCMTLACLRLQTRSLHPKCKFDHLFIPELYDFFWCNTKDVLTNVHSAFSHIYWKYKVTVKL